MTRPNKIKGKSIVQIINCYRKVRYPDEFSVRAAGQIIEAQVGHPLYLYWCNICRGWHLTKKRKSAKFHKVSYMFKKHAN